MNISNLGKWRTFDKHFQSVVPRAIFCATPDRKVGSIFSRKIATFNGQIFLTLAYFENAILCDIAVMFLDQVHGLLARMDPTRPKQPYFLHHPLLFANIITRKHIKRLMKIPFGS